MARSPPRGGDAALSVDSEGDIGTLAPGAYADVIAVGGDPLKDIKILEGVGFVMKDGAVVKSGGK